MGEIAPQIGLVAQYQVSRFLKLKEFRADIRRELLIELRNKVLALAKIYSDSTQLQNLDRQLEELLTEQIVELIREAETEAKIPQARPIRSLYARRLCNYLDNKTL
jgi:predicted RNase H-like nuclease